MDSLTFSEHAGRAKVQPVYVLAGDEDFLKRQAIQTIRNLVFGSNDDQFGLSTYAGDTAVFATVRNELETTPFLGSRRLVIVEGADPFVTKHRDALEKYVAAPAASGVLVLEVKSWPSNTRLAKLMNDASTIVCKAPMAAKLPEWCVRWTAARHQKELAGAAARLLVELVGPEMGLLEQELAKLAVYVGKAPRISTADVDQLVGKSRAENIFKIFDAIGAGDAGEALSILDRLFDKGEDPMAILGGVSWAVRRLAQVARLCAQGHSLGTAFDRAEVVPFARRGMEQQLRHLGRERAGRLYDWLLEVDLGLKGSSQLPPRTLLERFVVRLARKEKPLPVTSR
jgi:DNA polymerase-3 subunit delta